MNINWDVVISYLSLCQPFRVKLQIIHDKTLSSLRSQHLGGAECRRDLGTNARGSAVGWLQICLVNLKAPTRTHSLLAQHPT